MKSSTFEPALSEHTQHGWRNLNTQRQKHKAIMDFKSLNGLTPEYLVSDILGDIALRFRNQTLQYSLIQYSLSWIPNGLDPIEFSTFMLLRPDSWMMISN